MTEAVPLSPRLSVQLIFVVVGKALDQGLDFMFELLTTEGRYFRRVQWQA